MYVNRSGFTAWLTFVQILICIVSVSVYGFAPFGIAQTEVSMEVLYELANVVFTLRESERENFLSECYINANNAFVFLSRFHLLSGKKP